MRVLGLRGGQATCDATEGVGGADGESALHVAKKPAATKKGIKVRSRSGT